MDIMNLNNLFLTIERENLWKRQDQIIYKRVAWNVVLCFSHRTSMILCSPYISKISDCEVGLGLEPKWLHLTKGNFTRDEWNHLLCLFNISHFSSTVCSDTMAKRSQQDSGEERVTAKTRPMMNLIARTPSFVSSSTSVSPQKKHNGSQDPWRSVVGEERSGRLDKGTDLLEASDHHFREQFMEKTG